ncbi:D-alanyl-lipoteichoic acid biosynthesis protein DltB [Finegoldia magna]|uniref:D-alanyl-lipoteichoic acid biosynthesis protein DltB n=1 Tax=Finegoldia magna TaxID=1260 RepID=UPI0023A92F76|nr:D-alanyl-lipoteichoic acid biosynthesis protein DltB [Finegoldia magna]MCC2717618.1 D-alanyl-lipoteichoic acid biosynthesis protein DltB [Finegoldia magna]
MELFENSVFFVALAILSIPAICLGLMGKKIKGYGILATLFFVIAALYDKPKQLLYIGSFLIFEYIVVNLFLKLTRIKEQSESVYFVFLILSILPLLIYKFSSLVGYSIFGFIGISYMTFKCIQYVMEIKDGLIKEVSASNFFYLNLFFPSLISGPIDRSRRFDDDVNKLKSKSEYIELLTSGLQKILIGAVYKFVVSQLIYPYMQNYSQGNGIKTIVAYMYLYGFYLFFDFAGYSLMAIGTGNIFGVRLPDNFNKPFISKDIKEFWDRWHISLSYWFRDFVFSRVIRRMIRNKRIKNKLTRASIAFVINMLIMGLWHGLSLNYIIYGLYHGMLLAFTEVYQKKSKFHKKNKSNVWYKFVSWGITFNLVMLGFLIFSGRII